LLFLFFLLLFLLPFVVNKDVHKKQACTRNYFAKKDVNQKVKLSVRTVDVIKGLDREEFYVTGI